MTVNQKIGILRQAVRRHSPAAYPVPSADPHQSEQLGVIPDHTGL